MIRTAWLTLTIATAVIFLETNLNGQVPYRPSDDGMIGSRLNRRLDSAEESLQTAIGERSELMKQLADAKATLRRKHRDYANTRAEIRAEHDQTPELLKAREEYRQAQADFRDARNSVMTRLREAPAYKTAVETRDRAAEVVRNWPREFAKSRREFAEELNDAIVAVRLLEDRAIEADSTARAAKQRLDDAADQMAELIAQRDDSYSSDTRVMSAKLARELAQEDVERLLVEASAAEAKVAQAEWAYQRWVRQRLEFERAEQANRWSGWMPWYLW